jgi:hypothetical protein
VGTGGWGKESWGEGNEKLGLWRRVTESSAREETSAKEAERARRRERQEASSARAKQRGQGQSRGSKGKAGREERLIGRIVLRKVWSRGAGRESCPASLQRLFRDSQVGGTPEEVNSGPGGKQQEKRLWA